MATVPGVAATIRSMACVLRVACATEYDYRSSPNQIGTHEACVEYITYVHIYTMIDPLTGTLMWACTQYRVWSECCRIPALYVDRSATAIGAAN